jgi:hypothetical protein
MPDTRFTLIGKAVIWIVHATDSELRSMLVKGGWKKVLARKSTYYDNPLRGDASRKYTNGRRKGYGKIKLKSKRKPTAKQIKARKLFAMRAKRGDFRR